MADFEYDASLDLSQVEESLDSIESLLDILASDGVDAFKSIEKSSDRAADELLELHGTLLRIEKDLDRTGDQGRRSLGDVGKNARLSGIEIGAVSGLVQEVTRRLVELGAAGIRALIDLTKESVNIAAGFETVETAFRGIFDGNEQVAKSSFDFVRKESLRLGVDLSELAKSFIPKVENLEQFSKIAELTQSLLAKSPEQGTAGATIALVEALQGDLVSLQKRFEIDVGPIREAQKEFGNLNGLIIGLQNELGNLGLDFDNLSDTFTVAAGRGEQIFTELKSIFGEPILDTLKDALNDLFATFEANRGDIEAVASIFGELVAKVVEFVGSGIFDRLSNIDLDGAATLAENMAAVAVDAATFASQISNLDLSGINDLLKKLDEALIAATKINSIAAAEQARLDAQAEALNQAGIGFGSGGVNQSLNALNPRFQAAISDINQGTSFVLTDDQKAQIKQAGEDAFNEVISSTVDALKKADQAKEELAQTINDLVNQASQPTTTPDTSAADAILERNAAIRDEKAAADEAAAATEKLGEALDKLSTDKARAEADALAKLLQHVADEELKASQDREKNLRDFDRKIRELEIDAADEREKKALKIQQDATDKKLKIERDYQLAIEKIKRDTNRAIEDAALERDAIAYFEAIKAQQRAQEDARTQRDTKLQDAQTEQQRKEAELADLDDELQKKIEKEKRFLADRQTEADIASQQRLDKIQLDYDRQIEQINLNEDRKLEDIRTKYAEQIATLEEFLGQELDLRTFNEEAITQLIEDNTNKRVEIINSEIDALERLSAIQTERQSPGRTRNRAGKDVQGGLGGIPEFAGGGTVPGPIGSPQLVIAHGGEVITNPFDSPTALPQPAGQQISNINRSLNIDNINLGGLSNPLDAYVTKAQLMQILRSR